MKPLPLTTDQQRLVTDNLKLATFIASRFGKSGDPIRQDIQSEAYVGLCTAASKFDPSRRTKFSAYAWMIIKSTIIEFVKRENKSTSRRAGPDERFGEPVDYGSDPADAAALKDEVEFVKANLPRKKRGRRTSPRLTGEAIATAAGVSKAAACYRVQRARAILDQMDAEKVWEKQGAA